ncbi:MAG: hypothetical protein K6G80_11230, partial [Treponema sp.]|nr:hypothetical protein [Treponema sp.]
MNRKLFVLGLIFALAFLGSCTYEGDTTNVTVYKDAEEESSDFITEALPFYAEADEASDVFYVRFYNGNHNIPYVAVRYFLEECASFELQATSYADGKYKYQNKIHGKSFPLVVDMRADTMYCPEWIGYITKTSESAKMNDSFVKKFLNIIETFTGQSAQTFNLAKYGFKIYGGVDDAYVPLCVMNQLFSCTDYRRFVYNGEGIYFIDSGGSYLYANYAKSSWYVNEDGSVAERPADLITLSYNLLCFTHDYLYGQPGYYGFADDGNGYADPAIVKAADALSFDALLRQYSPSTRELLLSSSYVDYMKGMLSLVLDVYGDAHATLHTRNFTTFTQAQRDELNAYMTDELSNPKNRKYDFVLASLHEKRLAKGKAVMSGKTEIPTALELLPDGKTAVIRFDGFEFDAEGWQDYYFENQSLAPNPDPADVSIPDDTMGLFYTAFYTILHDASYANVKNVLVDVSCNGGGVIVTCQKALGYLLGNYTQQVCDVHTGTMYCQ